MGELPGLGVCVMPGGRWASVTVRIGNRTYLFEPSQAPVVVGRDTAAQVQLVDEHVSGTHLRLEHDGESWVARDYSRNGTFLHGLRQASIPIRGTVTVRLGHPGGVALTVAEVVAAQHHSTPPTSDDDVTVVSDVTDPGVARAGAAVAERRRELDLAQRYLAANGIISAGSLIDFEKGRRWPRSATRARLEEALGWPQGRIVAIRNSELDADNQQTEALTNADRAPLLADVMEVALSNLAITIEALPEPGASEHVARVGRVLADLRTLQGTAAAAARAVSGDPSMVKVLGSIRKTYRELMIRAASGPAATLGQRLFAARHRGELSVEELAGAAGVPAEAIRAAESEAALPPGTVDALLTALKSL